MTELKFLLGKTITDIFVSEDEIIFTLDDGIKYKMVHQQVCCESVTIKDIVGDLNCLLNVPLTMAERVYEESEWGTSAWTFYKFATIEGYVAISWFGASNDYYSEEVDWEKIENEESEHIYL